MSGGLIGGALGVGVVAAAVAWAVWRTGAVVAPYRAALRLPRGGGPTLRATVDGVAVEVHPVLPRFERARILVTAEGPPPGLRVDERGASGPPAEVAAAMSSDAHARLLDLCRLGPHALAVRDGRVRVTARTSQDAGEVLGAVVAAARALAVPDLAAGLVRVATTDPDASRRREAFGQLQRGSDARRVAARALLGDADPELRVRAAHALGDPGPAEALALSGDAAPQAVRLACTVAVMRQSPAWRSIVVAAAQSGDVARVVAAASGLAHAPGEAAAAARAAPAAPAAPAGRGGGGGAPRAGAAPQEARLVHLAQDADLSVRDAAKAALGSGRDGSLALADAGGLGVAGGGGWAPEEDEG